MGGEMGGGLSEMGGDGMGGDGTRWNEMERGEAKEMRWAEEK
jgi:hypothetical protein